MGPRHAVRHFFDLDSGRVGGCRFQFDAVHLDYTIFCESFPADLEVDTFFTDLRSRRSDTLEDRRLYYLEITSGVVFDRGLWLDHFEPQTRPLAHQVFGNDQIEAGYV